MIDTLHAMDQGLASHVIANVFVEIMALGHWGSNQKAQAAGLQEDMKFTYKVHNKTSKASKVQGDLTYERIKTSGEWPKLKAKAVATRHLAKFAAKLASSPLSNRAAGRVLQHPSWLRISPTSKKLWRRCVPHEEGPSTEHRLTRRRRNAE